MKTRGITGSVLQKALANEAKRNLDSGVLESSAERTASEVCVDGAARLRKSVSSQSCCESGNRSGENDVKQTTSIASPEHAAAMPCKESEIYKKLWEDAMCHKSLRPQSVSAVSTGTVEKSKVSYDLRPSLQNSVTQQLSTGSPPPPGLPQRECQHSCHPPAMKEATKRPSLCASQSSNQQKSVSVTVEPNSVAINYDQPAPKSVVVKSSRVMRSVSERSLEVVRPLPPKPSVEKEANGSRVPDMVSKVRLDEPSSRIEEKGIPTAQSKSEEHWRAVMQLLLQPHPPSKSTSSTSRPAPPSGPAVPSVPQPRPPPSEARSPSIVIRQSLSLQPPIGSAPPVQTLEPSVVPDPSVCSTSIAPVQAGPSAPPRVRPFEDFLSQSFFAMQLCNAKRQFHTLREQLSLFERSSDLTFESFSAKRKGLCQLSCCQPISPKRDLHDRIRCVRKFWPDWKLQQTLRSLPVGTVISLELSLLGPLATDPELHTISATVGDPLSPESRATIQSASGVKVAIPCPFVRVQRLRVHTPPSPPPPPVRTRLQLMALAYGRLHSRVKMKVDGRRVIGVIISCPSTTCDVLYRTQSGKRKRISVFDQRVSHVWFIKTDPTTATRGTIWSPVILSGTSLQDELAHETATGVAGLERKEGDDVVLCTSVSSAVENNLLQGKKGARFCTFNVRTANPRAQSRELLHFFTTRRIDVLVVPECRWTEVPFYFSEQHCALNPAVDGNGGIAIISRRPLIDILSYTVGHHGCISGKVDCGKFYLRILAMYCPHSSRPRTELDAFWNGLNRFLTHVGKRDHDSGVPTRRVCLGDMNAGDKIVKQTHYYTADLRADFMQLHDFRSCMEVLPKASRKTAFTWTSPGGHPRQLDGVLVQQRYFSDVSRVRILDPPLPSDHRPIVVDFKFHCRSKRIINKDPRPDYTLLQQPEVRAQCVALLEPVINDPTSTYTHLAEKIRKAAEQHLFAPIPPMSFAAPNDPVVDQIRKLGDLRSLMKASAVADIQYCTSVVEKFDHLVKTQPKAAYAQLLKLQSPTAKSWPTSSSASDIMTYVKSINGLPREHTHPGFAVRDDIFDNDVVSSADFTADEVKSAVRDMKNHKATGEDGVASEFFALPELLPTLLRLINAYLNGTTMDECLVTLIALVPKKGDLSVVENYRPVCLVSHFLKLINLLLLKRIRAKVDKFLRYGQNGFRQYRGTMSHAMALQMLIATGEPLYLLFVDFSSAFPSITFESIISALRSFRIPERIIQAVMRCHHGHQVRVKGEDGALLEGSYELLTGVMQGDTLAPYLFIMVLDCLLCELKTNVPLKLNGTDGPPSKYTLRSGATAVTNFLQELGYADDLLFPFSDIASIKPLLEELQAKAKSVGLDINLKKGKTEYVIVNVPDAQAFPPVQILDLAGNSVTINRASDYTYLGTQVVNLEGQVNRRIGLAWASVRKFRAFWDSKCPNRVKKQLFTCLVQSALTYGMELLTPALASRLDGAYGRMLTYVFARGHHQDEWEQYHNGEFPHLSSLLVFRRIKLVGHSLRRDEPLSRILRTNHIMCFRTNSQSDLPRTDGRKPSIIKSLSEDLSMYSLAGQKYSVKDAQPHTKWPKALDRDGWRKLANECAAKHEDELYAPLVASRVSRWEAPCHDPTTLDGRIVNKQNLKRDIATLHAGAMEPGSELDNYLRECRNASHGRSHQKCKKCFDEYVGMTYVRCRVNKFQLTLERNYRHDDAVVPTLAPRPPIHDQKGNYVRFRDLNYETM